MQDSAIVSTEDNNPGTTTLTVESNACNDASNFDAFNEEEDDVLDPAQIDDDIDVDDDDDDALDPEDEDPAHLPNNNSYFTEHDFLESLSNLNDATRHRHKWHEAWQTIKGFEGEEVVCDNAADGKVTWKVISECDEDMFASIRMRELELLNNSFNPMIENEPEVSDNHHDCSDRFWDMWSQSVDTDLERINIAIDEKIRRIKNRTKEQYGWLQNINISYSMH